MIPVIGNGVVVDPHVLLAEIEMLGAKGVDCSRLMVSPQAHLVLPYHQLMDELAETAVRGCQVRYNKTWDWARIRGQGISHWNSCRGFT